MASFYLPRSTESWFKHIQNSKESGFHLDFDVYYYCLMVGLKTERKDPTLPKNEMREIIRYFPPEYTANKHFIIAYFLKTELNSQRIKLSEKENLDTELARLLDPSSPTSLSEEGMTELNYYAFGGFRELQKHFPDPPRTLDSFLVEYYQILN